MPRPKKSVSTSQAQNAEPISKMEAVRRALADGKDTAGTALPFIKEQFGLEMTANHFNTYKSTIKGAKGKKRGRKPGRKSMDAAVVVTAVTEVAPVIQRHGTIGLGDIQQLKDLVSRYGEGTIKQLVELVG